MNNDLLDLADQLCVIAGIIMEDNNLLSVKTVSDSPSRSKKLDALSVAGEDIAVLIAAAKFSFAWTEAVCGNFHWSSNAPEATPSGLASFSTTMMVGFRAPRSMSLT